jgi:competence protein ComEA
MRAENREEATAVTQGGLGSFAERARARLAASLTSARDWGWGAVAGKALLAGLGLVLLGAIGRSALARSVLATGALPALDAGSVASLPAIAHPSPPTVPAASPSAVAPAPTDAPPAATAAGRSRATPDDPVFLNQATATDLRRLPGVGAKRAEAILGLRARLGHFRQIEDLLKVKGVGRSSLRKLRPLVRLDAPPASPPAGNAADATTPDGGVVGVAHGP